MEVIPNGWRLRLEGTATRPAGRGTSAGVAQSAGLPPEAEKKRGHSSYATSNKLKAGSTVTIGNTAYRITQEALTNVVRHARGAEATRKTAPDIVLMDIRMPVMDGIAATRLIAADGVRSRVLILTTFDLDEYVFAALRAGTAGSCSKTGRRRNCCPPSGSSPPERRCPPPTSPGG